MHTLHSHVLLFEGLLTLLYFCLPLKPLEASREERDVCLLHVGMPGQEGCCTKIVFKQRFKA